MLSKKPKKETNYDQVNFEKPIGPMINETRIQENFSFKKEPLSGAKTIRFKLPTIWRVFLPSQVM